VSLRAARVGAVLVVGASTAALLAFACAPAPHPEEGRRRAPVVLSAETDDELAGAELASEVPGQLGVLENEALQRYVQSLGARLSPYAPERRFSYTVRVVDPWPPNAFALPGGYLFVTRGVLALANDEDELAAVIAHEMAHAALRHHAGLQGALPSNPFALAIVNPAWVAAYQRDQERAADRVGQGIATAAGYDPTGLDRFLRGLGQVERHLGAGGRVPSFFDTHPPTVERAAAAADAAGRVARAPPPGVPEGERRHAEDYVRRLDGLVVGPNPAEGFFEDTLFVHPDLDFSIRFPEGWDEINTPASVGAISPDGSGRVVLEFAGKGDDPKASAEAFTAGRARELEATIDEVRAFALNGLPAYELRGEASGLHGRLLFVAHRGTVYRISSAARGPSAQRSLARAQIAARSFRPLSAEERARVTALRLRLAETRAGETAAELARRTGSAWDANEIALANALPASEPLEGGRLVKIARVEPYLAAEPPAPPIEGAPR
jgi:predicted Zn-dependent protease